MDIWPASSSLLSENWVDMPIIVSTDEGDYPLPDKRFSLIKTGKNSSFSDRLISALKNTKTEFVVFLLDDYFITSKIDSNKISETISFMGKNNIDYVHFDVVPHAKYYKRIKRPRARLIKEGIPYSVNTTPSIWKTASLLRCTRTGESAWEHEAMLYRRFSKNNFRNCFITPTRIPYLDGIRKGTILPKAKKYLLSKKLYSGTRITTPKKTIFQLALLSFLNKATPSLFLNLGRSIARKCGHRFYRDYQRKKE
jgi:hypothetical protein